MAGIVTTYRFWGEWSEAEVTICPLAPDNYYVHGEWVEAHRPREPTTLAGQFYATEREAVAAYEAACDRAAELCRLN